ncbi:DUF3391 domain-containing protein [Curvibacter sp. CHRR-16]|uniref:HD-GYP domain-containing protein n=1 Tax=Curvibacter sp. CHRR-16 TaxID=2835872 RepID=UPI001BD97388|nr:HD-GYP domain-containing protein [Curvibacter sp. CHRR-16]MBT0569210.1 DUF3391 domain-containing protein [Curvibacter sp. CHRR-16]
MTGTEEILWVQARKLRPGIYIELDLGWLAHPFLSSRFRIASQKQIDTIIGLKQEHVRCLRSLSDAQAWQSMLDSLSPVVAGNSPVVTEEKPSQEGGIASPPAIDEKLRALVAQNTSLQYCQQRFDETAKAYTQVFASVLHAPDVASGICRQTIDTLTEELNQTGDFSIRLLREMPSERAAMHPVNVTVLAMLLGRSLGLKGAALVSLGMAAFLHDIGKAQIADRLHNFDDGFSSAEYRAYQSHVELGVSMAERMGLGEAVAQGIAQHHEMIDGSGFPRHLQQGELTLQGRILALVNRYDRLCNPGKSGVQGLTPHEALSTIFAQFKHRFDPMVLSSFIRMMGVYPPGSVVQLIDDRFALVHAVNSSRPLKPRVVVHDPHTPAEEALIVDLEVMPHLGIRRSVKPAALPAHAQAYLAPQAKTSYFFESHTRTAAVA